MLCDKCGYVMGEFDKECIKCKHMENTNSQLLYNENEQNAGMSNERIEKQLNGLEAIKYAFSWERAKTDWAKASGNIDNSSASCPFDEKNFNKYTELTIDDAVIGKNEQIGQGCVAMIASIVGGLFLGVIIPVIGWIIGIVAFFAGLAYFVEGVSAGNASNKEGCCPYCGASIKVSFLKEDEVRGISCMTCKKRLIARNDKLFLVD
ncbi:MAG: hypothetical protein PHT33_04400 [bacterium]|nr:hypothetical protein [bacterium]